MVLSRLRARLARALVGENGRREVGTVVGDVRHMPGQQFEAVRYLYAQGPNAADYLISYAMNIWVYTAVATIASEAARAALEVWQRTSAQKAENHGLLALLGAHGQPNEDQDRFEFLERHFSDFILTGNSYWFWYSRYGGAPESVYILPPDGMRVVPGGSEVIGRYDLWTNGYQVPLDKVQVTHFRRYHPMSRYYGLSALEALRIEVESDRSMAEWNRQFFGPDAFAPAGILVVDETASNEEVRRLELDLEGKHGPRRRTAVVRGRPGATNWLDAGLKHHELDFKEGRLLSRQAVFEAIGLPLGLMSEASTEAHARVAERLMLRNVHNLLERTAVKLNADALPFWPGASRYQARFEDVRQVDWQMESMKLRAIAPFMTKNEVRERELHLPPLAEGGEDVSEARGSAAANPRAASEGEGDEG